MATGIVRKLDQLGRVVIPIEYRKTLGIKLDTPIEISVEHDHIRITRTGRACALCHSTKRLVALDDKSVCTDCIEKLSQQYQEKKKESNHV